MQARVTALLLLAGLWAPAATAQSVESARWPGAHVHGAHMPSAQVPGAHVAPDGALVGDGAAAGPAPGLSAPLLIGLGTMRAESGRPRGAAPRARCSGAQPCRLTAADILLGTVGGGFAGTLAFCSHRTCGISGVYGSSLVGGAVGVVAVHTLRCRRARRRGG